MGHEVHLFTYNIPKNSFSKANEKLLSTSLVSDIAYPKPFIKRVIAILESNLQLYKEMKALKNTGIDYVWIGSWDYKLFKLFCRLLKWSPKIIYQLHEHEKENFRYCELADYVVIPEENRGWLTFLASNLKRRPVILPNAPADHPREKTNRSEEPILEELSNSGKRIVLYQGYLHPQKRCLKELIEAISLLPENVTLAILPDKDAENWRNHIEKIIQVNSLESRVFFLENRTAPAHLEVVSMADVGIGLYRPTSINQVYCAPNRLFEFLGFGIPVVLPDFPGLKNLEAQYSCIATCNPEDAQAIAQTLSSLLTGSESNKQIENDARAFYSEHGNYMEHLNKALQELKN